MSARTTRSVLFVTVVAALAAETTRAQTPTANLIDYLDADGQVTAEIRREVRTTWEECRADAAAECLTPALSTLSATFREGVLAYRNERYATCATIMAELRTDPNPFLAVNAAAYEVKAQVAAGAAVEALDVFPTLTGDGTVGLSGFTPFSAELAFLRGFCLYSDLQYHAAASALNEFLAEYPHAPAHLAVAARRILGQLADHQPGGLGEIADLMNYAGQRLTRDDAGDTVRQRQRRAVELLDKLIDAAKQQERGGDGAQAGASQQGAPPRNRGPRLKRPAGRHRGMTCGPLVAPIRPKCGERCRRPSARRSCRPCEIASPTATAD